MGEPMIAMAAGNSAPEWLQIGFCLLLVGVLAALGNIYAQKTHPRPPGAGPARVRFKGVLIPFVTLKVLFDGLIYFLWLQMLGYWGLPVWGKVLITSGCYTPVYYVLFFLGLEVFTLGPKAALSARGLGRFSRHIWGKLKPVWRVDFWYFLVADGVSFYGGPLLVAALGLPGLWTNQAVFVLFSGFDFLFDVVLARAIHRGDGQVTERQVYLEAREAAGRLVTALRRHGKRG